ncbi:MAG: M28 family peptidase [Phycisphaerae bacterium]|jgi:N-acetylated-alpha-linked acidic dipeptidase
MQKSAFMHRIAVTFAAALIGVAGAAAQPAASHPASAEAQWLGYSPAAAANQVRIEQQALEAAQPRAIQEFARTLAARPHVAGTPAQAETRDYVIEQMRSWGLQTEVAEYEVYLPFATEVLLERISPSPRRFETREPAFPHDPYAAQPLPILPQHGYTAAGDASGDLVYVNYGTIEDLDQLAELGISLEGKIALARYGRIFRGAKVLNVQSRGAAACIIYSDPADDGYARGDVSPDGPMRPAESVQHGTVAVHPHGDPTTPGYASLPGAPRRDPAAAPNLPKIPSLPLSAAGASELLNALGGREVPDGWQGGLPFRYHVGPGSVAVRVKVAHDGGYRRIWNTIGRLAGARFPEEWIVIGAHRDAWCCGAADNVSGTAAVMETARICAQLAREGSPPARTLVFATWDAEEWGVVGSTEWTEQHRDALRERVVAYINQDMIITGDSFGASATPVLKHLVADSTRIVPHPTDAARPIFAVWSGQTGQPTVGTSGGGSDHVGFQMNIGLPCTSHGFGGRQGIYHSILDTPTWMERFGDPGYVRHAAAARVSAVLLLRLANAAGLPFDLRETAAEAKSALEGVCQDIGKLDAAISTRVVDEAVTRLELAADALHAAMLTADWDSRDAESLRRFNALLRQTGPQLTRTDAELAALQALAADELERERMGFERNVLTGTDGRTSYGLELLPGVRAALRARDRSAAGRELSLLADKLCTVAETLEQARARLSE